eukprot:735655-Pleurochrysis_carterae.AAC.2
MSDGCRVLDARLEGFIGCSLRSLQCSYKHATHLHDLSRIPPKIAPVLVLAVQRMLLLEE